MPIRISKNRIALDTPLNLAQSTSIASATTTDLVDATGNEIHITGTATITSFGTVPAGTQFLLIFDSTPTLTYNATSMILNTDAVDYVCSAGDRALAISEGSGNWVVTLLKKDGSAVTAISRDMRTVGLLGDSYAAGNADLQNVPHTYAAIEGGVRTALMYSGIAETFENDGIGGETTSQIAARKANVAAEVVIVYGGTNDINNSSSGGNITTVVDGIRTNLAETWDYLLNKGKMVIAATIPPKGTTGGLSVGGWSGNQLTMQIEANRWIREQAKARGMHVFEQFIPIVDPSSTTLAPRLNMLRDGTHLSSQGSLAVAAYNAVWIKEIFGVARPEIGSLNDMITYQSGGETNLLDNPAMQGSGGTATASSGTITGTIPASWRIYNVAGTQGVTAAVVPFLDEGMLRGVWTTGEYYAANDLIHDGAGAAYRAVVSHLAGATFSGDSLKWELLQHAGYSAELTIASAANGSQVQLFPATNQPSSRMVSGKYIRVECVVDIVNAENMYPPQLKASFSMAVSVGGSVNRTSNVGISGYGATLYPMQQRGRFFMRTPKIYIEPAGGAIGAAQVFLLNFVFSGTGSALVRVSQPRLMQSDS